MITTIINKIRNRNIERLWRQRNSGNTTKCDANFPINNAQVGKGTYGRVSALIFSDDLQLIVGSYCSIAPGVCFLVGADHVLNNISTFPFKVKILGEKYEAVSKGSIIVGDDVWLGQNVIVLSGVHIGQGAVIAAGAVVTSDVPPYAIVGGVPAKIIKYRFNESVIDYMLTLDYSNLTENLIKEHINDLYKPIDAMKLEELQKLYDWFPKRG